MQVTQAKFVQGFICMATDGFLQGWHERNAGNLSKIAVGEQFLYERKSNVIGEK